MSAAALTLADAAELESRAGAVRSLAHRALYLPDAEARNDARRMFEAEHESALDSLCADILPALAPDMLADVLEFVASRLRRAARYAATPDLLTVLELARAEPDTRTLAAVLELARAEPDTCTLAEAAAEADALFAGWEAQAAADAECDDGPDPDAMYDALRDEQRDEKHARAGGR